eukprot:CCRYP_019838-RA/>CCRYP_019838-RA protein AED:0.13 eAED:0.14 QI:50/0/0/1/0/0/2/0/236
MCRKGSVSIFEEDLTTEGDMCWMNADEFLCKYRVTRNQLDQLTNILSEDDPESDDAANYHGRKFAYSITVNVLNDDERRIQAYCAGYPGSAHDNRVWRNMKQHRDPESYFSENAFVMCDTAYEPSWFCEPAFKCVAGDGLHLHPHKTLFNTVLAKPRVVCEHTMGLWKGRFYWLRNIWMKATNNKNSLKRILRYIDSTIVVHNMLLDWREAEDRNAAWDESAVTDLVLHQLQRGKS